MYHLTRVQLPAASPGSIRTLDVLRFGRANSRPRAYLQAALHADEIPPLLVLQQLVQRLIEADREGAVRGEIVIVPVANPIGAGQYALGRLQGRFAHANGVNFNRGYPDVGAAVANRIEHRLGDDAGTNVALIRSAARELLGEAPRDEAAYLKHTLLDLAIDADIVLDLHCDDEAALHVYTGAALWPQARDLSAQLGAVVTLLADVSGGNPFDEAVGGLWWTLAARFPDHPIPPSSLVATVEYRGERDVDESVAADDADRLFRFLQRRGLIAGEAGPLPALLADATPLDGVATVTSPSVGVACYLHAPGTRVVAGQPLVTLVDPLVYDGDAARQEVCSPIDGMLFAHRGDRLARPGQTLCKIAGAESLPERRGALLLSD